jgi:hypothetical protein
VANPAEDINLPAVVADGQPDQVYGEMVMGSLGLLNPLDPTQAMSPPPFGWLHPVQVEERIAMLQLSQPGIDLLGVPMSNNLVPFFGPKSSARSLWIPLGLARINPTGSAAEFMPVMGVTTTGYVEHNPVGDGVLDLAPVIAAAQVDGAGLVAPYIADGGSTLVFDGAGMPDVYRVSPNMARRFSIVLGDAQVSPAVEQDYEVLSVVYDAINEQLRCTIGGGADLDLFSSGTVFASLRPHHYRVETAGIWDNLGAGDKIRFGFDATTTDVAGNPSSSGAFTVTSTDLARDITDMNDGSIWDFFRFEVEFDLDDPLHTPLPSLLFMKIPFEFGAE